MARKVGENGGLEAFLSPEEETVSTPGTIPPAGPRVVPSEPPASSARHTDLSPNVPLREPVCPAPRPAQKRSELQSFPCRQFGGHGSPFRVGLVLVFSFASASAPLCAYCRTAQAQIPRQEQRQWP